MRIWLEAITFNMVISKSKVENTHFVNNQTQLSFALFLKKKSACNINTIWLGTKEILILEETWLLERTYYVPCPNFVSPYNYEASLLFDKVKLPDGTNVKDGWEL